MKRIYLTLISILITIPLLAQTHNDYIENGVSGGVDRAFNGILWMIIIVVVLVVLLFVSGGLLKIYYWFIPDKKVTREQEIKILSDLLDKATEHKEAPKPKERKDVEDPPIQTVKPKPSPITHTVELSITGKMLEVCFYGKNYITDTVFLHSKTKYYKEILKVEADGIDITNTFLPKDKEGLVYLNNAEICEDTLENLTTKTYKIHLIGEPDYNCIHSLSAIESQTNPHILHHTEIIQYKGNDYGLDDGNVL